MAGWCARVAGLRDALENGLFRALPPLLRPLLQQEIELPTAT